jgi:hypothetical protein
MDKEREWLTLTKMDYGPSPQRHVNMAVQLKNALGVNLNQKNNKERNPNAITDMP